MNDFKQHIISEKATIKDALIQLNEIVDRSLTLFVILESGRMVGTLTDGDIRRKLIIGLNLDTTLDQVMNKTFKFVLQNQENIKLIRQYKKDGITLLPCLNFEYKIIQVYDLTEKISILPIDAVLMAGGKGERLRPLTENIPKPLLPIGDKTIIDYNIDHLLKYGIKDIFVTVNYLKEKIEKHFIDKRKGIIINCIREPNYLGTIGSVKIINIFNNNVVLIMNSDLFTNINYEEFYIHFMENDADMSVVVIPYSVSVPYGIFDIEGHNIKGINEKPTYNYYANAGIYLVKKELLDYIPNNSFLDATNFIELLIEHNRKVIRFPHTGYWIDIGKKEEYVKAIEIAKHL